MHKKELFKSIDVAFLPAKEIDVPELFSGRREEIIKGILALRSEGASLCIFGNRGVGKTSIARQLRLIAQGCSKLTEVIERPDLYSSDILTQPTVYFNCDDTIKDANDLFRKLLSDRDSYDGICLFNNGIILDKVKTKTTASGKLTLKFLNAAMSDEKETEHVRFDLDPVAAFKSVASEIVDSAGTKSMVVVIDEFERIKNKAGIASIMRTCPTVKFIIVGVAKDVEALIEDHESIKRQLIEGLLKIEPMSEKMLTEILRRAENILGNLRFTDEVLANIVASSYGYPHWVHLLGKWSCINAVEKGLTEVDMDSYHHALMSIVKNEPTYDEKYRDFVSESREKELILKLLALDRSEVQNISELFEEATSFDIGGVTWHECINELANNDIIEIDRSNFATFKDIRYKVYCSIRAPLYSSNRKQNIFKRDNSFQTVVTQIPNWDFVNIKYNMNDICRSYIDIGNYVTVQSSQIGFFVEDDRVISKQKSKSHLLDHRGNPISNE